MRLLELVKDHPFGVGAFIFAVCAGVVGNYVYDQLRQEPEATKINTIIDDPIISISQVPSQGGGSDSLGVIAGTVSGVKEPSRYRIAVYAQTDHWYVQPTRDESLTLIGNDGNWATETHLGTSYAALLVDKMFVPPPQPSALPRGNEVLTQVTVGAHISP